MYVCICMCVCMYVCICVCKRSSGPISKIPRGDRVGLAVKVGVVQMEKVNEGECCKAKTNGNGIMRLDHSVSGFFILRIPNNIKHTNQRSFLYSE